MDRIVKFSCWKYVQWFVHWQVALNVNATVPQSQLLDLLSGKCTHVTEHVQHRQEVNSLHFVFNLGKSKPACLTIKVSVCVSSLCVTLCVCLSLCVRMCLPCVVAVCTILLSLWLVVTTNLQQGPIILQLPVPRVLRAAPGRRIATTWSVRRWRAWPRGTPTTPRLTQTTQRTQNSCHPLWNKPSLWMKQ